jgi:hypothetical protein
VNADIILAVWAVLSIVLVAACYAAKAGETRRADEEADRRRLRNAVLNYRQGDGE